MKDHEVAGAAEQLDIVLRDQQDRWRTGRPLKVEDYLERLPGLADDPDCTLRLLLLGEFLGAARLRDTDPRRWNIEARFAARSATELSDELRSMEARGDISPRSTHSEGKTSRDDLGEEATLTFDTETAINAVTVGRYRLLRVLGEGSFGRVYLGFDEELKRPVAIKVPTPGRFRGPGSAEAFLGRGSHLAARLDHPNIVPVPRRRPVAADGLRIFIVSKQIEGCTLRDLIRGARPGHAEAAELMATVAQRAACHAHERRLIHRDVKPGNILIESATGTPFVADFGLAISDEDLPDAALFAGTPAYMSPEQARGEGHRLDGRSDIFSWGIIFYELATAGKKNPSSAPRPSSSGIRWCPSSRRLHGSWTPRSPRSWSGSA